MRQAGRASGKTLAELGAALARWAVLASVAVVPLLLDLGNVDDTYYGLKARVLILLGGLAVLGVLLRRAVASSRPFPAAVAAPLVAFGAAAIAATLLSINPRWALAGSPWRHEGLLLFLAYAALCAAAYETVLHRRDLWLGAVLTGAGLVAVYAVAQYFGFEWLSLDPVRRRFSAAFSTTGHPNHLGAYMTLVLPLAVTVYLQARRSPARIVLGGVVVLLYGALLFSFSRAAWAGTIVALGVLGWGVMRAGDRAIIRRAAVLGFVLLAVTVVFAAPNGPLAPRAGAGVIKEAGTVLRPRESLRDRLYLWEETANVLARRPLLGYGPDTFALAFPQEWDTHRQSIWGRAPRTIDRAHNDLLDMTMSLGVAGLIAYVGVIISAVGGGVRGMLRHASDLLPAAGIAGLAGYLTALQFGFSVVSVSPVYWSVLGAGMAFGRAGERHGC